MNKNEFLLNRIPLKQCGQYEKERKNNSKTREKILKMNRVAILSQYFTHSHRSIPFEIREDLLGEILLPQQPSISMYKFKANTTKIINEFYKNVDFLVSSLPKLFHRSDFDYVTDIIIPSLFGFFTYNTQIQISVIFYTQVIAMLPQKVSIQVVKPFFNNQSTYDFFNSSLSSFFNQYFYDNSLSQVNKYATYATLLIDMFIENLPLLSHDHISLLQIALKTYDKDGVDEFFIENFLMYNTFNWFRRKRGVKRSSFIKVCDCVRELPQKLSELYSHIINNKKIQSPNFYADDCYVSFLVNIKDICSFAHIIDGINSLPDGVDIKDFDEISKTEMDKCVLLKIQMKVSPRVNSTCLFFSKEHKNELKHNDEYDNIIQKIITKGNNEKGNGLKYLLETTKNENSEFKDYVNEYVANVLDEKGAIFEKLLDEKLISKELDIALKKSEQYACISLPALIIVQQTSPLSLLPCPEEANEIRKMMALIFFGKQIKNKKTKIEESLKPVIEPWIETVSNIPITEVHPSIMKIACNLVTIIISCLDDPFFSFVNSFFYVLDIAAKTGSLNEIIQIIVTCAYPEQFIKLFLIINACPMRSAAFLNVIETEHLMRWRNVERFVFKSVSTDKLPIFLNVQERIYSILIAEYE